MKTAVGLTAVMVLLVTGCSTTQRVTVKDEPGICAFLGEVCHELQPGARGEAGLRWVNPASDLTRYHQVILEMVGFFGTEVSKVSPAEQERLTALFQQALTDALATKYQVVDQPTPGTVQLQVVILDAEAATPGLRSVSMAIPQARLLGTGYYAASGTYPFVGGAQAAFKATDAVTGQVLGAGADRQVGGGGIQTAAQWRWGDAENAIKAWSQQLPTGCMPTLRAPGSLSAAPQGPRGPVGSRGGRSPLCVICKITRPNPWSRCVDTPPQLTKRRHHHSSLGDDTCVGACYGLADTRQTLDVHREGPLMRRTPLSTSSPAGATTAADWRGRTTEPRAAHEAPTSLTLVKTDAFLENQP